ncbi:MAG: amidohydrolase family protein [Nitrospinae bacterium]|nr:amidohydrolase family protein [Nitrospinota bacterium]
MDAWKVIDADGHAMDYAEIYSEYLEEPYVQRRRGSATNVAVASWYPVEVYNRNMDQTLGKPGRDLKERLSDMDLQEIDVAVLYPTFGLFISQIKEKGYAAALCRAYNNWIADQCKQSPRLKAVALLPVTAPEECPKELNRAVTRLGLLGAMLAASGLHHSYADSAYFPLYEEAQRLNVPLAVHASGGDDFGSELLPSFIATHTCGHPFPVLRQLTAMIFEGIPELFPRLTLGFLEIGCGWLPYWMERMDEEYEKRAREAPLLKGKPSEYLTGGRIYYSCEPDEKMVGTVVDMIGPDRIMYASDYPHWDMTYPESAALIKKRGDLSDEAKRKILYDNARRFYPALTDV